MAPLPASQPDNGGHRGSRLGVRHRVQHRAVTTLSFVTHVDDFCLDSDGFKPQAANPRGASASPKPKVLSDSCAMRGF